MIFFFKKEGIEFLSHRTFLAPRRGNDLHFNLKRENGVLNAIFPRESTGQPLKLLFNKSSKHRQSCLNIDRTYVSLTMPQDDTLIPFQSYGVVPQNLPLEKIKPHGIGMIGDDQVILKSYFKVILLYSKFIHQSHSKSFPT